MLAISLHATTDEIRDKLVPLNRKYPIARLLDACRNYPGLSNARRITFEYVMLKASTMVLRMPGGWSSCSSGIPAKVNLIPFNPWPGSPYDCSDWETIERFTEIFNRPAMPARCARRAAATSWRHAASSNPLPRSYLPARSGPCRPFRPRLPRRSPPGPSHCYLRTSISRSSVALTGLPK